MGDEEYIAEGQSIKKAQHMAADEAIKETKYNHPPARSATSCGRSRSGSNGILVTNKHGSVIIHHNSTTANREHGTLTPTVELNALAMKRGEPAVYLVDQPSPAVANNGIITGPMLTSVQQQQSQTSQQQTTSQSQTQLPQFIQAPPTLQQFNQFGNFHRNNNGGGNLYQQRHLNNFDRRQMGGRYNNRGSGGGVGGDYQSQQHRFINNNHNTNHNTVHEEYRISLQVGQRKFLGVGSTLQAARHDAASR